MDPTQHPILSIFEEDTHIDMKAPFNDIDLLRFNKIITNLVLENFGQDFDLFETIRANLRSIVDKMNERKDDGSIPSNASNELLNHNRLYCVNNKHLINFDEAYEYTGEDLVEFLNTKWRVNKEKKVHYTEEDLVSKNLESKESEIDEVEDTNGEDNVENSNDEKNVEDTNEEENVENSNDEDNVENSNEEENVENSNDEDNREENEADANEEEVKETKEAEEVRTFRSGRKVARTATSGKPEDDEKDIPTDKEQLEESENNDKPAKRTVKEIEPSVKRTLRRGRTRGTIVDDPPEVDNKDASPPRTRRTLRSRK